MSVSVTNVVTEASKQVFCVTVRYSDDIEWMLRKRYSEFRGLYDIIRDDCPAAKVLSFPAKSWGNPTGKALEARRVGLDIFVQQIVEMSCQGDFSEKLEDDLDAFLEIEDHKDLDPTFDSPDLTAANSSRRRFTKRDKRVGRLGRMDKMGKTGAGRMDKSPAHVRPAEHWSAASASTQVPPTPMRPPPSSARSARLCRRV